MTEHNINFNQQRDFGEVLNATFAFFRLNLMPLGRALLLFACPFLILQGIVRVTFDQGYSSLSNILFMHGANFLVTRYFSSITMLLLTSFLSNLMANLTVYSYIKAYNDKSNISLKMEDVWRNLRGNFFRLFFASMITTLMFYSGLIMCFIPGIYLYVSLSFTLIIMMFEGASFGQAFSRSFSLAHYQWWSVFLLLLMMIFILYIISLIFTIPQTLIKSMYHLNSLTTDREGLIIKYVLISMTMLSTLASGFMYCVMYIAMSFKYFSIVEKKESPGLLKEIAEMENS